MIALIKKIEYLSEIRPEAFALTSDPSASLVSYSLVVLQAPRIPIEMTTIINWNKDAILLL